MQLLSYLLLIALAGTGNLLAQDATENDYALIEQTLHYYLDGGTNNDYELLEQAFHPDARMEYVRNGEHVSVNAREFFKQGIDPDRPPSNRQTRVVAIDLAGTAASATIEIQYEDGSMFVDFMNLLKTDGQWQIVSKIFYRRPAFE